MSDTLFRDELLESGRWLDLPTDTDRLSFFGLRLRADDFGNVEGGLRKLFRFLARFTQIKTEEVAAVTLEHLLSADLIRPYKANDRDFYHLPRCRTPKSYLVRKCPASPWCNPEEQLGKHIRKITKQGLALNVTSTSLEHNKDVLLGVGVGVGVGVVEKRSSKALSGSPKKPANTDDAIRLLEFLNRKAGRRFRPTETTLKPILDRLKEYTFDECRGVIVQRWVRWGKDPKMADYMRPDTLFRPTNFAQYVGDVPTPVEMAEMDRESKP